MFPESQYFTGEHQKYRNTLPCEPDVATFYSPKENTLGKFSLEGTRGVCSGSAGTWLGLPLSDTSISPEPLAAFSSENERRKHAGAG